MKDNTYWIDQRKKRKKTPCIKVAITNKKNKIYVILKRQGY